MLIVVQCIYHTVNFFFFFINVSQERIVEIGAWKQGIWIWAQYAFSKYYFKAIKLSIFFWNQTLLLYLQGQFAPIRGNYSPEFRSLVRFGNVIKICQFLQFLILQTKHLTYMYIASLCILKLWLFYIASTFIIKKWCVFRWQTYFRKTQIWGQM